MLSKDEFIERASLIHNDKYDYSKVVFVDDNTEVCIICPKHGEFWQKPKWHLYYFAKKTPWSSAKGMNWLSLVFNVSSNSFR